MAHLSPRTIGYSYQPMRYALYFLWFIAIPLFAGCRAGGDGVRSAAVIDDRPPALDPRSVEQGEAIYAQQCAACHGVSLEGEADWKLQNPDGSFRAPPHDASGHTWHHSDAQLLDAIRLGGARLPAEVGGTSAMPAYASILSEQEIVAVLDFIKSTWPEEQRLYQWERTLQAQP